MRDLCLLTLSVYVFLLTLYRVGVGFGFDSRDALSMYLLCVHSGYVQKRYKHEQICIYAARPQTTLILMNDMVHKI